jgi:hypothetical protein
MGSSRSWGAEKEDEDKVCQFGVVSKYFDTCCCEGCEKLRERNSKISVLSNRVRSEAEKLFSSLPENQWKNVTSIKIKDIYTN